MQKIINQKFIGERSLFQSQDIEIVDSVFYDGESPLKESRNIHLEDTTFSWKYPLWYCQDVYAQNVILHETARSGIWYTNNIQINNSVINAPKTFRRANNITLTKVSLFNAEETMWTCNNIKMQDVTIRGDYFGKDSQNIEIDGMELSGNYAFDGVKNITITNSRLISKDAFWNCEDVVVKDSVIIGEYLGWNSKNLTFENCYLQSEQGFCYINNLVIKDSKIINTDLAFEYSSVDVQATSKIDSVKNPLKGKIVANAIDELILSDKNINTNEITIIERDEKNEI